MATKDWTKELVEEAVETGERIPAINKANGKAATRYVHPDSGQSVVIENESGQILQVGGPSFKFRPDSGDLVP